MLATAPTAHWIKVLDDAGVPCGPVYNYEQLFADPQVQHREMVVHADDAELGPRAPHPHARSACRRATWRCARTAPKLGQHTDEILAGLGYAPADIAAPARASGDLIFLIRHGETLGNASRTVQLPDNPLSPRGIAQAERLARRLEREGIGAILSSDYARAAQTAERLRRASPALPIRHDPLLQERNFGDIRGTPYAELGFDMFALDYAPPNGETWEVFHARVDRAWALVQETRRGHRRAPGRRHPRPRLPLAGRAPPDPARRRGGPRALGEHRAHDHRPSGRRGACGCSTASPISTTTRPPSPSRARARSDETPTALLSRGGGAWRVCRARRRRER